MAVFQVLKIAHEIGQNMQDVFCSSDEYSPVTVVKWHFDWSLLIRKWRRESGNQGIDVNVELLTTPLRSFMMNSDEK